MMQSIANIVMYVLVITIAVSVFRMRNKMYMVHSRKVLFGAEMGAPISEPFPVTKFKTIDHEEISIKDHLGRKTILLVTSLGCSVCKTLYPNIKPFSTKYGDRFQVISLMNGELPDIEALRDSHALTNPIVHMTREDLRAIKTESYPFGYLLSPEGEILTKGFVKDNEDLEIMRDFKINERQKKRKTFYREFLRRSDQSMTK